MSQNFRRDLNREFDAISGSPSPALSARVRSALAQGRPARTGPFWMAGLAAGLIAAIVVGVLVVASFNRHQTGALPGTAPTPSATPSSNPSPSFTPSPSPAQTPPDSNLPAFICAGPVSLAGAQSPAVAFVDAVRTGTHTGYDRVTIEFNNGEPGSVDMSQHNGTTFTQGASGQQVTLNGIAGLLVIIHGADEHTAYSGSTDIKTVYSVLLELRQVEDFEGTVQWGLGLSKSACYRAFYLANPARLVIDIQNS
ncbi:MAG TPA: hypothetical protein DCF65_12690 [Chloroflexi bacterium]|jgi:hypothetical protein|nr:hypothetical protein [Chloroflexota bacterium]HAF19564.1 hypothetical protein [Chloroflexota bacterium]